MGLKNTEQHSRADSTSEQGVGMPTGVFQGFTPLAVASFLLWEPSSSGLRFRSVSGVGGEKGELVGGREHWEYYLGVPILKFLFFKFFPHFG